jgi:hypothetical protein
MPAYLEETVKPNISFFNFLGPANETFPAEKISISTDVATDLTLGGVIPWATVCIDLEPYLLP